ncbi:hypothetical protein VNO77_02171 [Canavalia gladiata]|uniref:Glycoside hydrolase family 38 central domain-containing protein n=1 Tax=Canavalia gladiata TaxID=3824 RepID=A0AAN9MXM8_CANGL
MEFWETSRGGLLGKGFLLASGESSEILEYLGASLGFIFWAQSVSGDPNRSSKNEFHLRLPERTPRVQDKDRAINVKSSSKVIRCSCTLNLRGAERDHHTLIGGIVDVNLITVEAYPGLLVYTLQQDYWSGYYVSRPFFKAVDKVLEQTLCATEMMVALVLGGCRRAQCEKFAMGCSYKLTAARRNLAPFQHHDEVTGTAKDHVVMDYRNRTHTSLLDVRIFMSKPSGDALPSIDEGGQLLTSEGLLMQEVYSYPRTAWEKVHVFHSTRLYSRENIV